MRKFWFLVLMAFFVTTAALAKEPENLYLAKQRVIQYYDSGEYAADIGKVTKQAQAYLQNRINQNKNGAKKLAVVFDIDDTTLSEYDHWKALKFGGSSEDYKNVSLAADGTAIPEVLGLYNFAKENHVAVFLVTGREESVRDATVKNLEQVGYKDWSGIFFRSDDYYKTHQSIIPFKSSMRKTIVDQGYDVVFSIGDQKSDYEGGYDDRGFKLPNPYYYIP